MGEVAIADGVRTSSDEEMVDASAGKVAIAVLGADE